jgi:uncharacterized protein (DUF305 family)
MSSYQHRKTWLCALGVAAVVGLGVAGCDGSDDETGQAEQAFLAAMAPHHESAVAMADVASKRAAHPQLKQLARAIVNDQQTEIATIAQVHMRLTGEALRPNADAHQQLGLSSEQAGMMHDGQEAVAELRGAKAFDRAFIDAMVPHHQGAIRMARAVLAQTDDEELRRLAGRIEGTQAREIEQMNRWRAAWYGAPSPAGGVPKPGSTGGEAADGEKGPSGGAHEGH